VRSLHPYAETKVNTHVDGRLGLACAAIAGALSVACSELSGPTVTARAEFSQAPAIQFEKSARFRQVGSEHSRILRLLRADVRSRTGGRDGFQSASERCEWWRTRGRQIIVHALRSGPFGRDGVETDRRGAERDLADFAERIGVCGNAQVAALGNIAVIDPATIHPDSFQWFPSKALERALQQAQDALSGSSSAVHFSSQVSPLYSAFMPNWVDAALLVGSLAAGEDSYHYWEANPPGGNSGGGGNDPFLSMALQTSGASTREVAGADMSGCAEAVFMTWWGRLVSKSMPSAAWMCLGGAVYRSGQAVF